MMKYASTNILRLVIILVGAGILALCVFGLPKLILSELEEDFDYGWIFVGMYIPAIPFFIAIYNSLKLLKLIDKNKAFTKASVRSLRVIKICAYAVSGLYAAGMPYIFYVADRDDAPGVVLIGLIFIFASFIIATAAGLFQHLLQNALEIKSENDLTV